MEELCKKYTIPQDSKMVLYTRLRLAHSFAEHTSRLKCVQARLHAISVLGEYLAFNLLHIFKFARRYFRFDFFLFFSIH